MDREASETSGAPAASQRKAPVGGNREAGLYLAHLIRCSLAGEAPQEKPGGFSWGRVLALAERNGVDATCWPAACGCADVPPEVRSRWQADADVALYRHLAFSEERAAVLAEMEERGLSYLPLKGILLAELYPQPGMRPMADNDILYGYVEPDPRGGFRVRGADAPGRERAVREATDAMAAIMAERGYDPVSLGVGNHDSFHRAPFNFEMHRRLVSPTSPHAAYYENPWARAVRDPGSPWAYSFSDEDEYVYLVAHAFKHFDGGGCGIRFAVDLRVLLDAKGARLDRAYVDAQLEELGLSEFEGRMRSLADSAFGDAGPVAADTEKLLLYLLGCGTYGTVEIRMGKKLAALEAAGGGLRAAKLRYLAGRLVPGTDVIKENFPVFYRHKALLPLFPAWRLYRLCRRLVVEPSRVTGELRVLWRHGGGGAGSDAPSAEDGA